MLLVYCTGKWLVFWHTDFRETKNPCDRRGKTTLHYAAEGGHFNVCKFLLDNVEEKNPKDINGKTPDEYAFVNGHLNLLRICEVIPETIEDQNLKKVLNKESGYPGEPQHQDPEFQAKFQHMLPPHLQKWIIWNSNE